MKKTIILLLIGSIILFSGCTQRRNIDDQRYWDEMSLMDYVVAEHSDIKGIQGGGSGHLYFENNGTDFLIHCYDHMSSPNAGERCCREGTVIWSVRYDSDKGYKWDNISHTDDCYVASPDNLR